MSLMIESVIFKQNHSCYCTSLPIRKKVNCVCADIAKTFMMHTVIYVLHTNIQAKLDSYLQE